MMIKVCGITRHEDALAAVDAGASAIGFIFYPKSPRYISPELAAEIGDGLNVLRVGIFVDTPAPEIAYLMQAAELDVAQIYGGDAPLGIRTWRAFRVSDTTSFSAQNAEAILLDGPANGISFDWKLIRQTSAKVIVAGGLDASNVAEAIHIAKPWGVDASSQLESVPGLKDHQKIRAFVKAALTAGKEIGLDLAAR